MNDNQLLTVDELAGYLKVSKGWIYRATSEQRLPMLKVGRYCRFRLDDVLETLNEKAIRQDGSNLNKETTDE